MRRDFPISRVKLGLGLDVFNLFNTVVFGGIQTNITNANFGRVSSQTNTPRVGQIKVPLGVLNRRSGEHEIKRKEHGNSPELLSSCSKLVISYQIRLTMPSSVARLFRTSVTTASVAPSGIRLAAIRIGSNE